MYFIGADLGTSAVKLLLMDETGNIEKIVSREYPLYFPKSGWSEQSPEDWYEQTVDGIRELTADIDKTLVAGISFGGQMHGLVILDENDRVIRPAILWNDGRTQEETDWLNQEIGEEKLGQYTANIAFAGFTAPKLLWVKKNEPENFKKIAKIMLPKDYLAYRLSGTHCSDYSDAAGMLLMDVKHKSWSEEMLKICGVTEDQLPKLYESYDVVGTLTKEAASDTGLPESVKVIAGAGDNAAAAVGTGTVGDGACNISLGTSGTMFISSAEFKLPSNHALHSFCHADGHFHLMACTLSAASSYKWWLEDILGTEDYGKEQALIDRKKLGMNSVFYLPHLMGERFPHNDTKIRAMFYGMAMDTTRADMEQAVMEGVAFSMRDALEVAKSLGITITRSKVCGGGAKSDLWKEILADVLNIEIDVLETEQGPGLGAAMLAAVGCKAFSSVEEAAEKLVRVKKTVKPDPEAAERYDEAYRFYHSLYPAIKTVL